MIKQDVKRIASDLVIIPQGLNANRLHIFETRLDALLHSSASELYSLVLNIRKTTFTLANLAESEAMGRALGKSQKHVLTGTKVDKILSHPSPRGGQMHSRIEWQLARLKGRLLDGFHLSMVQEEALPEMLDRIDKIFPKASKAIRPKKVLKHAEADEKSRFTIGNFGTTGYLDEEAWNQVVHDYLADEIPFPTFGRTMQDYQIEDNVRFYDWEIEQEITQDFVYRVRDGQVDAANTNGIEDFAWIAILDKNTCDDCCAPRNGLSSSEIESALENGDLDSDACEAIVPPAHINCRCIPAPMTMDMPDAVPVYQGSFEDWMNERLAA